MKPFSVALYFWTMFTLPSLALAATFQEVWHEIYKNSPVERAMTAQTEATQKSGVRAENHWLPRLYLDARGYRTSDPGASFFGLLQQRALQATDFNPTAINHPNERTYLRGALGLDLPLYEGGRGLSQVRSLRHSLQSQIHAGRQATVEQYARVAQSYASLSVLENQLNKFTNMKSEINATLSRYGLRDKSNPVGYSGFLGLQAVMNRIEGFQIQYQAQKNSYLRGLSELGYKKEKWLPEKLNTLQFVSEHLISQTESAPSFKIQSSIESAQASEERADLEKSKYLPRLGAFAEAYTFNGARDTAQGHTYGLYLQWNLFDPSSYGSVDEAKAQAYAQSMTSKAFEQQERAERAAQMESMKALEATLTLLSQSYGLLEEQSRMSTTLFKNGSISALQMAEIMGRKADLLQQQTDVELNYLKSAYEVATRTPLNLSGR